MARCEACRRSGVFLRTNQGLCGTCEGAQQVQVEKEKERLKEALIYVRCMKDQRDRVLHLKRALDSARTLADFERLGYFMKPKAEALVSMLTERLDAIQAKRPDVDVKAVPLGVPHGAEDSVGRRSVPQEDGRKADTSESERRRSGRKHEALLVQIERGVRALSEDISARGVRVNSPLFQKPGARVRVTVHVPEGPVTTEGIVRWSREVDHVGTARGRTVMGLEFSSPQARLSAYGRRG